MSVPRNDETSWRIAGVRLSRRIAQPFDGDEPILAAEGLVGRMPPSREGHRGSIRVIPRTRNEALPDRGVGR